MKILIKEKKNELAGSQESLNFKEEKKRIYKSKISDIPTPGYTGHQSTYTSPIGYLNKGKILNEIKEKEDEEFIKLQDKDKETTAGYYNRNKQFESEDLEEVNKIFQYLFYLNFSLVTLYCWLWRI